MTARTITHEGRAYLLTRKRDAVEVTADRAAWRVDIGPELGAVNIRALRGTIAAALPSEVVRAAHDWLATSR